MGGSFLTVLFCFLICLTGVADERPALATPMAPHSDFMLILDPADSRLNIYAGSEQVYSYEVELAEELPAGEFCLQDKGADFSGQPAYRFALNVAWQPLTLGNGDQTVRLSDADAAELYAVVPAGSPLTVQGVVAEPLPARAALGDCGPAIVRLEQILNARGFWCGPADGRFTALTGDALRYCRTLTFLPATGILDSDTVRHLYFGQNVIK